MKVSNLVLSVPSLARRALIAIPLMMAVSFGAMTAPAHAITRTNVIKRANHWIKHRVKYSQHARFGGYRRDCSGFVSMAWKLKTSYTSSSIRRKAHRISWRNLKPGDAVRRPGHVEIFGGWKNRAKRSYWALEESTWGKPALRRVKTFKHGNSALRYKGIEEPRTPAPSTPTTLPPTPPSSESTSLPLPIAVSTTSYSTSVLCVARPAFPLI